MVALADVRRWDAEALEAAFTTLGAARDHLLDLDASLTAARPPDAWAGPASDAARAEHNGLAERMRRVAAGATACRPVLADTVDAVAEIRRELARAESLAQADGFAIAPDGAISDALQVQIPVDQVEQYRARRTQEMTAVRSQLEGLLARADQVDAALADVLTRAAAGQVDDGDTTGSLTAAAAHTLNTGPPPPPVDQGPAAAHTWWAGLTAAQRDAVLVERPELVGNRDGIPAAVRDEANRAQLPDQIAGLDAELATARTTLDAQLAFDSANPSMYPEGMGDSRDEADLKARIADLQERRAAAAAIERALGRPDRHLLLLDLGQQGGHAPHAAVAVGDIDTADHVAVFTPGLTTTVASSLEGYTGDVQGVRDVALNELQKAGRRGADVAAVAWLGYDAPQLDATLFDPAKSVASAGPARAGGADLARFYDGIGAARPDDHPHVTALGHSYGSTTTGYALQHTTTQVDDAVVFGSPGLGTSDVSDLHVTPGHVNVLEADWDPVADLATFGDDPNHLDGVTDLSSEATDLPDGEHVTRSTGHSEYFTPGTTSQYNIAGVVAGLGENRVIGGNSGLGDPLW